MMQRLTTLLALAALAVSMGGCGLFNSSSSSRSRSAPPPGPVPRPLGAVDPAVRTLTLSWNLPDQKAAPSLVSWENVEFKDETGRVWSARNVHWGKGTEGYWTAVSFMFPPDAQKISASMILRVDGASYPLTAVLTRINPTQWRADYNVMPAE